MADERITVIWLYTGDSTPAPEPGQTMNRAQRRRWAAIEKDILSNTRHWPRYRCKSGHLAAVDPAASEAFVRDPCEHCGSPVSRDAKEVN